MNLLTVSGFSMIFPEINHHSFCSAKCILNKMLVMGEMTELPKGYNEG